MFYLKKIKLSWAVHVNCETQHSMKWINFSKSNYKHENCVKISPFLCVSVVGSAQLSDAPLTSPSPSKRNSRRSFYVNCFRSFFSLHLPFHLHFDSRKCAREYLRLLNNTKSFIKVSLIGLLGEYSSEIIRSLLPTLK